MYSPEEGIKMEKPKEKTPEQIFGEKFSLLESTEKPIPNIKKEAFPWAQKSPVNDATNYKPSDELLARGSKGKVTTSTTAYQLPNLNYTKPSSSIKKIEVIQSHKENNTTENTQHVTSSELLLYQKVIDSLRAELQEYKYKIEAIQPEIMQYDKIITSLKSELAQHRNEKPQAMSSEVLLYQQSINSLRIELAEYKNKVEILSAERNQQNSIDVLRAELAEYKNKVEILSAERNQQNSIDVLRAELAEYKNKINSTQPANTQNENMMRSIGIEISRLKNNLDSLILK
jgi:predicted RNase H-like nuclease (RuvC/YqgF family)